MFQARERVKFSLAGREHGSTEARLARTADGKERQCSSVAKGSLEVFKSGDCSEPDLGWWVYGGD